MEGFRGDALRSRTPTEGALSLGIPLASRGVLATTGYTSGAPAARGCAAVTSGTRLPRSGADLTPAEVEGSRCLNLSPRLTALCCGFRASGRGSHAIGGQNEGFPLGTRFLTGGLTAALKSGICGSSTALTYGGTFTGTGCFSRRVTTAPAAKNALSRAFRGTGSVSFSAFGAAATKASAFCAAPATALTADSCGACFRGFIFLGGALRDGGGRSGRGCGGPAAANFPAPRGPRPLIDFISGRSGLCLIAGMACRSAPVTFIAENFSCVSGRSTALFSFLLRDFARVSLAP